MNALIVVVVCCTLAAVATASSSDASLSISSLPEHVVLQPGDSASLPCTVVGEGFSMWYNPIVWYKKNHGQEEVQINNGAVMNEPFLGTGRYSILPDVTPERVKMSLDIENVKLADNGTYRCELRDQKAVLSQVMHHITVPAPIEELTLSTNQSRVETEANSTRTYFEFEKLQPAYVGCISKGGNPQPVLRMYRGRTEVTDEFQHQVVETFIGPIGLEEVRYEVQLSKPDFMADADFSGHNLKCVSKVPRSGKADKLPVHKQTRVATMEVKYPPEFDCARHWSAFLQTERFAMECSVHANPQVELDTIYWRLGDSDNATRIDVGQSVDGISANISVDRMTDKVRVTLLFDQINSTHFQHYVLRAKNDLGERNFQAVLSLATTTVSTTTPMATSKKVDKKPNPPYGNDADKTGAVSNAATLITYYSFHLISIFSCLKLVS